MRILLTGATGFIGSNVARILLNQGHELSILLRSNSNVFRIRDVLPHLRSIPGDAFSPDGIANIASLKFETCIHLAWYAEPGKYLNAPENLDAVSGSLRLVSLLMRNGCARFIGVGSCFEYDPGPGLLSETTTTLPASLYGASKLALSNILAALQKTSHMSSAWLRLFYQYGPHEDERRLIPAVITSLLDGRPVPLTSGTQIRDFLHVTDVAQAICTVAQSAIMGPVNVGSGFPISVRAIASRVAELIGRPDLLRFGALEDRAGDPPVIYADNQRLQSTGWTQQIDLTSGLRGTIDWWQSFFSAASGCARAGVS